MGWHAIVGEVGNVLYSGTGFGAYCVSTPYHAGWYGRAVKPTSSDLFQHHIIHTQCAGITPSVQALHSVCRHPLCQRASQ